ncbi:ATP synthase F1 subunit epsilon [Collinsella sp. AGMB00827]|uniref:ATP synthase epsilon chain n=1 Tax=Collinsella ureilytica TaxID=2869515 RepID=A0ABS7MJP9_9ACTN|nr:ATP synthase F1 subunit epsilon [Collinsella urealyticum]
MHVRIVCPEHLAFEEDVAFLTVPSTDGSMGIAPRHASEIFTIEPGFTTICAQKMGEVTSEFAIGTGFVEVADDRVIMLVERAENVAELKASELQTKLKEFEEELGNLSADDAQRVNLYNEIAWCKLLLKRIQAA